MKIYLFIFSLLFSFAAAAQSAGTKDLTVNEIEEFDDLFRYKNWYLGGQPNLHQMEWLKDQGVSKIVNIRTSAENEEFEENAFDEKEMAENMGFEYVSVPVDGYADFTPEKLNSVANEINTNEKILLHCRSAGRVTYFFMAYLVEYKGFSLIDAVGIGEQLKYYNPLEDLLDTEIKMRVNE